MTKLDILVFGAHPDDAELGAGGTIAAHIAQGKKVGMIDLTQGELGSRGTPQTRKTEAAAASEILGITVRENLGLLDGFFENNPSSQLILIQAIRKYQPEIVLANAPIDRHIDHGRGAALAKDACFLSGLAKISTQDEEGREQTHWRPKSLYHYIQDYHLTPSLVVDVSKFWNKKMDSIKAYSTQFYTPDQEGPQTPISSPDFLHFLDARGREMGRMIGVEFGEGFIKATPIGTDDLFKLM
jgi:bacillithiol biosynthesis deacetylase BshB1